MPAAAARPPVPNAAQIAIRLLRALGEVALGLLVLGVVLVVGTWLLSGYARARAADDLLQQPVVGEMLAHDVHRLGTDEHGRARLATLEVLDGATFSPPRDARGEPHAGLAGWSQQVSLLLHDRRRASPPVAGAFSPRSWDAGYAVELLVTIRRDDVKVGTWRWWIAPPPS